jgi:hypothetical protein
MTAAQTAHASSESRPVCKWVAAIDTRIAKATAEIAAIKARVGTCLDAETRTFIGAAVSLYARSNVKTADETQGHALTIGERKASRGLGGWKSTLMERRVDSIERLDRVFIGRTPTLDP